ncbi:MAG TPA: hypothetical protein VNI52_00800 [Sphingobacteriaceae bacterium]|nr:hypothetical protein [Sphingobacteriaceae bacterium]
MTYLISKGENLGFTNPIFILFFALVSIAFGTFVPKLLTPPYKLSEESYINDEGQSLNRIKVEYK